MEKLELVRTYFPELGEEKISKLEEHAMMFKEWNDKINLVSRKDIENFEEHHILHSLAFVKRMRLPQGSRVLDVGTGGGLPGIPLAICFPDSKFFLLDSITKKAKAVEDMKTRLGLENVEVVNKRAEKLESKFHFIIGRAVTVLPRFIGWIQRNMEPVGQKSLPNGVIYWKGSLYQEELESIGIKPHMVHNIQNVIKRDYFDQKYMVHIRARDVIRCRLPEE